MSTISLVLAAVNGGPAEQQLKKLIERTGACLSGLRQLHHGHERKADHFTSIAAVLI
ncbi:hypothetical protein [Streptomyces sp. TLI_171]|uniref:hypothetical protein n=1 Tax=Streptomyces sp. TLI_171 TaxID=1938859 RepID=UPI0015D52697|nr:hypothetical protein [Streptomyces sp. TLI_171]